MDMPTPCILCTRTFELNEGREGLTHDTAGITICSDCHEEQQATKTRVDEIRELLCGQEDAAGQVEDYDEQISELLLQKESSEGDLLLIVERLDELKFKEDRDTYHEDIQKFY